MIDINNRQKQILKLIFVLAILGIIIYTFRDSAGPILKQLKETSVFVILGICVSSTVYECVEGWITYSFARQYNPDFSLAEGIESAFYCSFYRVATLGSGAGVAAVYFFSERGIPIFKGTGLYMIEYVLHKLSIAVFSVLFFAISFSFMMEHYGEYSWMLIFGYGLTVVIAAVLILFCCSARLHGGVIWLVDKMNRKGKLTELKEALKEQFRILEDAAEFLLKKKGLIAGVVLKNLLKLAFWYGIPFFILHGLHGISLPQTFAVTSLAVMLAAVVPSPAGIGSTEFLLTMLFSVLAGTGLAGSASLLYRFATFVFPFLVGAVIIMVRRYLTHRRG